MKSNISSGDWSTTSLNGMIAGSKQSSYLWSKWHWFFSHYMVNSVRLEIINIRRHWLWSDGFKANILQFWWPNQWVLKWSNKTPLRLKLKEKIPICPVPPPQKKSHLRRHHVVLCTLLLKAVLALAKNWRWKVRTPVMPWLHIVTVKLTYESQAL